MLSKRKKKKDVSYVQIQKNMFKKKIETEIETNKKETSTFYNSIV